jgi:hypothetical protein
MLFFSFFSSNPDLSTSHHSHCCIFQLVSEVCKQWYLAANSDQIWARLYHKQQQQQQSTATPFNNSTDIDSSRQSSSNLQQKTTKHYKQMFIQQYLREINDPKYLISRLKEVKRKLRITERESEQRLNKLNSELIRQRASAEQMEKKMMLLLLVQNRYVKLKEKYKLQEKKLQQIESICEFRGQQIKELKTTLSEKEKTIQQLRNQLLSSNQSEPLDSSLTLSSSPTSAATITRPYSFSFSSPVNIPTSNLSNKKERRSSAQRPKPQSLWRSFEPVRDSIVSILQLLNYLMSLKLCLFHHTHSLLRYL